MEERNAIERLRRGDIGGLEFLVRCYQVRAVRTAYLVTRDLLVSQDVVQDAFLKAFERIDQFDGERPFGPWFLRSVLNDAIKAARKLSRNESLRETSDDGLSPDLGHLVDDAPGPDARWEQAETAEEVWMTLQSLSPEQRAAVVARYFLGLSEAEMAEDLGCRVSTVKWRLHAARQRLRLLLRPMAADTCRDGRTNS